MRTKNEAVRQTSSGMVAFDLGRVERDAERVAALGKRVCGGDRLRPVPDILAALDRESRFKLTADHAIWW